MARELEVYEADVARALARAMGRCDTLRDCLGIARAARAQLGGA
jgi:hypothetical protein